MHRPYVPPLPQVQVELKKGETIMTDAVLHLPASFLHEAFSNRSGVPLEHFELYYRGKRLEGEAALASWGIGKGSTVEVKMRGRGGADKQPQKPDEGPSSSSAPRLSRSQVEAQEKWSQNASEAAPQLSPSQVEAQEKWSQNASAAATSTEAVPAPEAMPAPEAVHPTAEVQSAVEAAAAAEAAKVSTALTQPVYL